MAHTYEELKKKTVADLRELAAAQEHEALQGYSSMRKEPLLEALCTALGIEAHAHHDVVGLDKSGIKQQIRALKEKRAAALEARDPLQLKRVRRKIHRLKRKMRAATV